MSNKIAKPVITIPLRVNQRAVKRQEKIRMKELEAKHSKYYKGDRTLPPLIKCRRSELDHYKGQIYPSFKKLPMATEHWMSRSTIGDFFAFIPFRGASSTTWHKYLPNKNDAFQFPEEDHQFKQLLNEKPTFETFGLDSALVEALKIIGIKNPTNIQYDSLSPLLNGEDVLIASETGNGKTLAFLIPTLQKILNCRDTPDVKSRPFNSPLAVIASPGRELSAQIRDVAESLCYEFGINIKFVTGGNIQQKIDFGAKMHVDILIGSVGAMNKMFEKRFFSPNFVDTVIFDEIDTMVDDTFIGVTSGLLAKLKMKFDQQLVFAGATLPSNLDSQLGQVMDPESLHVIQTNHLHKVLPHVYQKFIRAPKTNRIDYLMDLIANDVAKKKQILIFCNKASTSAYVSHFLNDQGIESLHFAGGNMHPSKRQYNLKRFLVKECNVLTCTDLVSRGIDTQMVQHVVNYDFPQTMTDYIHRVGRVGRVGSNENGSKVTNLVCGKISIALVQELEKSVRLNKAIPEVESNVVSLLEKYHKSKNPEEMPTLDM